MFLGSKQTQTYLCREITFLKKSVQFRRVKSKTQTSLEIKARECFSVYDIKLIPRKTPSRCNVVQVVICLLLFRQNTISRKAEKWADKFNLISTVPIAAIKRALAICLSTFGSLRNAERRKLAITRFSSTSVRRFTKNASRRQCSMFAGYLSNRLGKGKSECTQIFSCFAPPATFTSYATVCPED